MLFTGLGRSVWEKTVPLFLSAASGRTQDLGHSFFLYGPPGGGGEGLPYETDGDARRKF